MKETRNQQLALANGASNLYAFCQHHTHLNLPHHGGEAFKTDDLRLAEDHL
ncbi:hypothetical protein SESBI_23243 [Sesbania bispinosa]|nr:hypothetical protein SESBI_23243 [Sesbania bispinosa]